MPRQTDSRPGPEHECSGRGSGGDRPPRPVRSAAPESAGEGPDENLVVVRFKGSRKSYFHNRSGLDLAPGQPVLVEADRGRDLGRVVYVGRGPARWWKLARRQGVLDVAGESDLERLRQNRDDEFRCRELCQEKIHDRGLPMDLVGCERQWDGNKITFYFTADGRVDFRQLVRDLAAVFRTRIELRQIGVRDEARLKGGVGVCGREFCCSSFMHEFSTVTLRMAKDQQLPMNPAKLSGLCGRLRCCLAYEHPQYRAALAELPRAGARVTWRGRPGRVRKLDPVKSELTLQLTDAEQFELVDVPADEVIWERSPRRPHDDGDDGGDSDDAGRRAEPARDEAQGGAGNGSGAGQRPRRRGGRRRGGRRRGSRSGGGGGQGTA